MKKSKTMFILAALAWVMTIDLNADVIAASRVPDPMIKVNNIIGASQMTVSERGFRDDDRFAWELYEALGLPAIARPDWGELDESLLAIKGAHMSV